MRDYSDVVFVSDMFLSECQGGAEIVDDTIVKHFKFKTMKSIEVTNVDPNKLYVLSNTYQLPAYVRAIFKIYRNYIIFEHDYKIHASRQPNLFPNCIIPVQERINYDYYANANVVFLQSEDHLQCFKDNQVPGNFINLRTSIWSEDDLKLLESIRQPEKITTGAAIVDYPHPAKGKAESIEYAVKNNIQYTLIPRLPREEFYKELNKYSKLIYIPKVKESFCRLIVEAKALYLDVVTGNSGVTKEEWFMNVHSRDIIDYLRDGTETALQNIERYL